MTSQLRAALDVAMALPDEDRLVFVEQLLETFSPQSDDLTDDQLAAELARRKADFDRGAAGAIPWSQLRQEG